MIAAALGPLQRWPAWLCLAAAMFAAQATAENARVAIIIDDMGNSLSAGRQAVNLPGAVTYAFLPQTPHARELAERAHARGKQVMLHLPMEAVEDRPLGPVALTLHMTEQGMRNTLKTALSTVPYAVGVNNHMGSLMTRHPGAMQWLMSALHEQKLFFIDSRTTKETVAERLAGENAVAVARRHVFLDDDPRIEAVRRQFKRLLHIVRRQGEAIAIGHPNPNTLKVLAEELPRLQTKGIELVPASRLTKTYRRKETWLASSSPSPKVVKNSKPLPSSTCCGAPGSK